MKLKELFDVREIVEHAAETRVLVNEETVWDYKDQDGELRLIHEPVGGSEDYGFVYLTELRDYGDFVVKSETVGGDVTGYELIRQGKVYKLILHI